MSKVIGVVHAGGKGERFGSYIPKQFISLNGKMVVQHTIDKMYESKIFQDIYILIDESNVEFGSKLKNCIPVYLTSVNRIENTNTFFKTVMGNWDYIVMQDSVRPFTPSSHYIELQNKLKISSYSCLITGQNITDALIEIRETIYPRNRQNFFLGQTPEIIKVSDLVEALNKSTSAGRDVTSFAEFMTRMGYDCEYCELNSLNLKLTYERDLFLAEQLLKYAAPIINKDFNLYGKKILIFGGTGDIGKATVDYCKKIGADVTIADRYRLPETDVVYDSVIISIGAYCTDEEDMCNKFSDIFNTNVYQVINLIEWSKEYWLKNGGSIVILGSMAGFAGRPNIALYGASKAAIHNYIESYASTLLKQNIKINCIAPGKVIGKLQKAINPNASEKEMIHPEDIAKIVANYIITEDTGQIIPVRFGLEK